MSKLGLRVLSFGAPALTLIAMLGVSLALPDALGPSLATWPPMSGYLAALALLSLMLIAPIFTRQRRVSRYAREHHRDALEELGDTQIDIRELSPGSAATLRARLVRSDAPEGSVSGGEPRLVLRGSQATSWSTHLPRQLALQVATRRMTAVGVATLQAGSHERWLEYAPEVRPPDTAPEQALVVIERALHTGDEVLIRGRLRRAQGPSQPDGEEALVMHGDHREPIMLASLRPPSVSLPRRSAGPPKPLRLLLPALLFLLSLYASARYHWVAANCTARQCGATTRCAVKPIANTSLFRCTTE